MLNEINKNEWLALLVIKFTNWLIGYFSNNWENKLRKQLNDSIVRWIRKLIIIIGIW